MEKARSRQERFDSDGQDGNDQVTRLGRSKITTQWELITPDIAHGYRARVGRNRHFSATLAWRYQQDMSLEQWQVTHQGIAFDVAGECIDGQHRLEAIIESGVSIWMLVTRGLAVETIEVLDRGRIRSLAHQLQILGHDMASNFAVAVARAMFVGPASRSNRENRPTDTTIRKFMEAHREAILFAETVFRKPAPPAQVPAVLARAYYHASPEALTRFGAAARDDVELGEHQPGDRTARLFYSYLTSTRSRAIDTRTLLYRKTQRALRAYLDGEDLGKLYETEEDLFVLPKVPSQVK
jgi:hypothetical protein